MPTCNLAGINLAGIKSAHVHVQAGMTGQKIVPIVPEGDVLEERQPMKKSLSKHATEHEGDVNDRLWEVGNNSDSDSTEEPISARRRNDMDLFFAAAGGELDTVKALLAAGVSPNVRDYEHRCPLHVAAGFGYCAIMQLLLEREADVEAMDFWGAVALDSAQKGGHLQAEKLLRDAGARLKLQSMQRKACLNKWEIKRSTVMLQKEISRTCKSVVHKASWNNTSVVAKFAISEDGGETIPPDLLEELLHEISLLASVRHPDLVMFLGCCLQEMPIMFISAYMPRGDLENYYRSKRVDRQPWAASKKVVAQWSISILRALQFLHHLVQPIIHRDLKPLNILLTDNLEVKVADFGISKVTSRVRRDENRDGEPVSPKSTDGMSHKSIPKTAGNSGTYAMTGGVGSWRYMAPEVARHQSYSEKVDIFAFALVLYFMSCGRQPFREYEDVETVLEAYRAGNEPRPKSSDCPTSFRSIMEAAWHSSPESRPSAEALCAQASDLDVRDPSCLALNACITM